VSLIVLCPTRGRPASRLEEVLESFNNTRTLSDTELIFVQETDNPEPGLKHDAVLWRYMYTITPRGNMQAALNTAAMQLAEPGILGFIGDDHRFRSEGWDQEIEDALATPGIAYGDDLVQGADLPTQWFVSSSIVKALGWFALPACNHFYLDNAWKDLGEALGILRYLPQVKIEHLHFSYGKSDIDDTYRHTMRVGSADAAKYSVWRHGPGFENDLWAIKSVL